MEVEATYFLIFDLDGTLIDSDSTVIKIINEIRVEESLEPVCEKDIRSFLSLGGTDLIRNTITNSDSENMNEYFLNLLRKKYLNSKTIDILYDNVSAALKRLTSDDFQLILCTNKANYLAKKILKELEVDRYFKKIVADGDLTTRKPNINNFRACFETSNIITKNCLIIGDSWVDLELAKNADVSFCAFSNGQNEKFISENKLDNFDNYSNLTSEFIMERLG